MSTTIGVLKESAPLERRVGLLPDGVRRLVQAGHRVMIEAAAGKTSGILDSEYAAVGGVIVSRENLVDESDVLLMVQRPAQHRLWRQMRHGALTIGLMAPRTVESSLVNQWCENSLHVMSLDLMPRISRAQSMDVLSSMATVAGYRAVIWAAERSAKFFPLLMTAAGTITPARILVLGVGVAGLQAIATAHRLGAVVEAFDTREAVREQVESLGAKFLTLPVAVEQTGDGYAQALSHDRHQEEIELLAPFVRAADVVITTAQIPGKQAPVLITREMLQGMQPGAVVVDLAAEGGGNTEVTQPGEEIMVGGVRIMAPLNVPSSMAHDASQLFSRNIVAFLTHLFNEGIPAADELPADEIIQKTTLTHEGRVVREDVLNLAGKGALHVAAAIH